MNNEFTLFIDTTDSTQTIVGIKHDGKMVKQLVEKTDTKSRSQNILPLIEKIVQLQKCSLADLTSIEINPGPGSFTGVRVGVSVANALGWVLQIPVNGKKVELPVYEKSKFDFGP